MSSFTVTASTRETTPLHGVVQRIEGRGHSHSFSGLGSGSRSSSVQDTPRPYCECPPACVMMNKDRRLLTEKLLNFTLEIIYLLTGEDCIVVKNPGNHGKEHANPRRTQIPGTEPPPHPLMDEKRNDDKILELTNAIIQLLTGEVPVRCEDVTVYFSTEEWEYLEGHRELYNGTPVKNLQLIYPNDKSISRRSPMKCHPALTFSDMVNRHSSEKASQGVTAKEDCTENKTARSMYPSISNEGTSTGQNENLRDSDLAAHRVNHWVEYRPTNRDATATGEEENLRECDVYRSLGYPSNSKEEQMAKVQNEDLRDTIISTHTVTPPMEYMSLHIKKESDCKGDPADRVLYPEHLSDFTKEVTALCDREGFTEHDLYVPAQIEYTLSPMKEESSSCEGQYDNDMQVLMDNAETEHIKEESSTWDEENHTDMSTERTAMKYPSIHIKEEPDSWEEVIITDTDISVPPEHAQMGDVLHNDSADPTSENNDARSPPVMSFRFMKFNECGEIINNKFHTHTVEGMYNCSDCQKCFANNFDVFRHQAAHKDKMLACPECGKDFSCKARLIRHYRSHTGTKLFSCSECGKRLTDKSSLITHQRSHMGDKPFSCDVCRKSFTTQSDLVRHQRTHTGEKPFSCPDCGKCFSQSSHLLRHQRLHTGDKTFMCFVCRTSFPDKLSLAAHHRIHAGENPFLCTVCGKSFFTQEDLSIHQRVHLEDQTFLCFACGKCFPESAQLTRHLKSHTAEDQFFGPI